MRYVLSIFVVLLGAAAVAAAAFSLMAMDQAEKAKNEARDGAAVHESMSEPTTGEAAPLVSYAGAKPADADAIAKAHKPYDAVLPALQPGNVVKVKMVLKDVVVEIAPGVKYRTWSYETGAPGPIVHVRQGQTVEMTLVNGGAIAHSIDFHAARIAPNIAFRDVAPGESFTFRFKANDPGVYMYHCGTKPVLAHIANGMYGAIVVQPAKPLPKADREYVLVSSEWYLNGDGLAEPASYDANKAHAALPDWVTWNGYANQYVTHPLEAKPNETVRFWVVAAGPSFDTDFHVVGTIFDRAWVNQDMTQFQRGVQTVPVVAGGGGVFDVKIADEGLYPIVSHSFASVDLGQVGILKVGNPSGSMSH